MFSLQPKFQAQVGLETKTDKVDKQIKHKHKTKIDKTFIQCRTATKIMYLSEKIVCLDLKAFSFKNLPRDGYMYNCPLSQKLILEYFLIFDLFLRKCKLK